MSKIIFKNNKGFLRDLLYEQFLVEEHNSIRLHTMRSKQKHKPFIFSSRKVIISNNLQFFI